MYSSSSRSKQESMIIRIIRRSKRQVRQHESGEEEVCVYVETVTEEEAERGKDGAALSRSNLWDAR